MSEKNFPQWKEELTQVKEPESLSMTDEQVEREKAKARKILKRFSPGRV